MLLFTFPPDGAFRPAALGSILGVMSVQSILLRELVSGSHAQEAYEIRPEERNSTRKDFDLAVI